MDVNRIDDGSSTESESFEPDQERIAPDNEPSQSAPPPATPGINILDLHAVVLAPNAAATPAPISSTNAPPPKQNSPPSVPIERQCLHILTEPLKGQNEDQREKFDCACCGRKGMDGPNFSGKQRRRLLQARKCRNCTYELSLPRGERHKYREKCLRQATPDRTYPQTARIPWRQRLQQIRDGSLDPLPPKETSTSEASRESSHELQDEGQDRHDSYLRASEPTRGRPEEITPAEKKRIKRQKRMAEMAEVDQNPPPPQTPRPLRAAAVKARDDWKNRPYHCTLKQQPNERAQPRERHFSRASTGESVGVSGRTSSNSRRRIHRNEARRTGGGLLMRGNHMRRDDAAGATTSGQRLRERERLNMLKALQIRIRCQQSVDESYWRITTCQGKVKAALKKETRKLSVSLRV